ncbi:MAG: BREX system ATP-binding domain-containing protein [Isosphaerales bacterium]
MHVQLHPLQDLVSGFDFAAVIVRYVEGFQSHNDSLMGSALRWLRAEYRTKTEARQDLEVRSIIDDFQFYDYLKLFAAFVRMAGYAGLLINIDEMGMFSHRLNSSQARAANYEVLLRILNDCLQGNVSGLGFLFGGTDTFLEDRRRGLFSYEALASRLADNAFAKTGLMRWTKLRQIQVDAIHQVFDGTGDLIIAAKTAAGKTEAAFLPILSHVLGEPSSGVRAIYAGPLKALINDQFSRLEELCQEAEIPVHKWHGDVSSPAKRRLLEHPSGILLITPESIESLFVNHPHRLTALFPHLAFIVIDELHSFIGTERGAHLRSLICRLAAKSRDPVRRAGLSATLGSEIGAACRWLRPSQPEAVRIIEDPEKLSPTLRSVPITHGRNPRGVDYPTFLGSTTVPFPRESERKQKKR